MNKLKTILLLVICASMIPIRPLVAEEGAPDAEKLETVKMLYTVNSLREIAVKDTAAAVKALFGARAAIRWQGIAKEFSEEQLNDFFTGTVVLGDKNTKYSALYNPFWDTILLLHFTEVENVPKVERFALVSGCKFRGEPYPANPAEMEGTVPKANPYAVDLWAVTSRTSRHYEAVYAPEAQAALAQLQLTDLADMEKIQMRSAVRLKLMLKFIQNKPMRHEAQRISLYLTGGHEEKLKSYFTDGGADFIPQFARLNIHLRQHFIPYCYFPGKDATLFVFFNSSLPRIIVTVTLPRKGISRILEWYDLNASEELMAVWNKSKEDK